MPRSFIDRILFKPRPPPVRYVMRRADGTTLSVWRRGKWWGVEHPDGNGPVEFTTLADLRAEVGLYNCTIIRKDA